jgi:hypothetical protein
MLYRPNNSDIVDPMRSYQLVRDSPISLPETSEHAMCQMTAMAQIQTENGTPGSSNAK